MDKNIHYIHNDKTSVVFVGDRMELYPANTFDRGSYLASQREQNEQISTTSSFPKKLKRITLCVSNDCNLRCKYCYASGGNYGENRFFMDKETALEFVDFCYRELTELECVMFFGGEPLLNWKVIKFICEEFEKRFKDGGCLKPKFTLVTNGTIYNATIFQLIKKNICSITVSIDGKEDVNNYNRVYPDGKGSFERISNFIHNVKKYKGVKLQFEATYTKVHEKFGYTRYDVKKFLTSYFGIQGIVVDENSLDLEQLYSSLKTITKDDILKTDFECLPNDFWHILYSLATKKELSFCSIAQDRITISSSGEIYACQLLNGKKGNVIGYICEAGILDKMYNNRLRFSDNSYCKSCWAKPLCGGCVVQKFYDQQNRTLNNIPNEAICLKVKKGIESILMLIYMIRSCPETWQQVLYKIANTEMYN